MFSVLLAAVLSAGPTFTQPPAPVDHRPCVSAREFNGTTREELKASLEARWEVEGLGDQANVPGYGRLTLYPRCGVPMDRAWYGVQYLRDQRGRFLAVGLISHREHRDTQDTQAAPEPADVPCPECTVITP